MTQKITKKPDRIKFFNEVREVLVNDFGAIGTHEDEYRVEYRMNTKAGPLDITIHKRDINEGKSPCTIFTRFDYALKGEELVGASVPSGKWNHHFETGTPPNLALNNIVYHFSRLMPTSLDVFMDETSLVPQAVLEGALEERNQRELRRLVDPPYMGQDGFGRTQAIDWLISHCEERFIYLYDSNANISQQLRDDSGRDVAYAFVHHWLDAYLDCPPDYRKKHPLLRTPDSSLQQTG